MRRRQTAQRRRGSIEISSIGKVRSVFQASVANTGDNAIPIAASRGSVTSFPGPPCGGIILLRRPGSALTGNRDVFVAANVLAVLARLGNRGGDFLRVDAPIRGGLGEIP